MKFPLLKINRLSIFLILCNLLCLSLCHAHNNEKESSRSPKDIEKRIEEIFGKRDAEKIFSAHRIYEINLSLIGIILDETKKNKSLKRALEQYEFSPTDKNLQHFYKEAEKIMEEKINKCPESGDWKFHARWYGGLSSIVYIHIHNFPYGVPASRNRDHLLKPIK